MALVDYIDVLYSLCERVAVCTVTVMGAIRSGYVCTSHAIHIRS